jgi:hypothetical protein
VQNGGKNLANSLLKGSRFAAMATSLVDKAGIPSDKDGRVTLKMSLSGTTSNPKASFKGFGKYNTSNSTDSTSRTATPKKGITAKVKDSLSQTKEQVESKIQEGKSTFESQIRHQEEHLKGGIDRLKKFFK